MDRISGSSIDQSVAELFRWPSDSAGPVAAPGFARQVAGVFKDAQSKRHDADYDLNKTFSATDARLLLTRVKRAIGDWRAATSPEDRDFKHALAVLMLLRGKLRQEP